MAEGATSAITALATSPGSGSVAFDTTVGAWVFNGEGDDDKWKTIHRWLPTTRVQAYISSAGIPTSGSTVLVPFDTEVLDSLGEYSTTTSVFSAKDHGFFLVETALSFKTNTATGGDAVSILLSGSAGLARGTTRTTMSSAYSTIGINSITEILSGGTLAVFITAPSSRTTTIASGAGCSYLRIHRVS